MGSIAVADPSATRGRKGKSLLSFPESYVVIDIETTGLDPHYDAIIELAAVRYVNNAENGKFTSLVKPPFPISSFIEQLTGITNEMVSDASSIADVLPKFLDFIGDSPLVGHNVNFDVNFIYDNCMEILGRPFTNDFCDTLRLSRRLFPDLKNHKLSTLAEWAGLDTSSMHRAFADCCVTNIIYERCRASAIEQYGSLDAFSSSASRSNQLNVKDITTDRTEFDKSHPLYGKVCVFTGKLERFTRKEAMQAVVDLGGECGNTVTAKTNFLVLGCLDYATSIKGDKSSKQRKAEDLILSGADLQIISENVFLDMLGQLAETEPEKSPESALPAFESSILHEIAALLCDRGIDSSLVRWQMDKMLVISAFYSVARIGVVRKRHYITFSSNADSYTNCGLEFDEAGGHVRFYLTQPEDVLLLSDFIANSIRKSLSEFEVYRAHTSEKTIKKNLSAYLNGNHPMPNA